jgi:ParB family chromosome partitioning protein
MSRKNLLDNLGRSSSVPVSKPAKPDVETASGSPIHRGAVGAIGRALHGIHVQSMQAEALHRELASADRILLLDPALIDPSPIRDRIPDDNTEEEDAFRARIEEEGQRVPILVRPNPQAPGRYLTIYGHRRLRAITALGRQALTAVTELSDEDAAVAQGLENNDRNDLTFIERCLYAKRLVQARVRMARIAIALGTHKTTISTYISITEALSEDLILAIGRAPDVGRPRWMALVSVVEASANAWRSIVDDPAFSALSSNERFQRLLDRLSTAPAAHRAQPAPLSDEHGRYALVKRSGKGGLALTIPGGKSERPDGVSFADWMEAHLKTFREDYLNGR